MNTSNNETKENKMTNTINEFITEISSEGEVDFSLEGLQELMGCQLDFSLFEKDSWKEMGNQYTKFGQWSLK